MTGEAVTEVEVARCDLRVKTIEVKIAQLKEDELRVKLRDAWKREGEETWEETYQRAWRFVLDGIPAGSILDTSVENDCSSELERVPDVDRQFG